MTQRQSDYLWGSIGLATGLACQVVFWQFGWLVAGLIGVGLVSLMWLASVIVRGLMSEIARHH
jgi:uncharacterized membrane protein (Fun14 family)